MFDQGTPVAREHFLQPHVLLGAMDAFEGPG